MSALRLLVSSLSLFLILAVSPAAQSQRPLGIVDLLNIPQLSDPQLSSDGRQIAFTQTISDWQLGRRVTHIWRAGIDGGQPVQLTTGPDGETSPRWSPDGATIAFLAKRGTNEFAQIYLLPVDGGEPIQLTTHATAVSDITWTPDGAALLFRAPDPKTPTELANEKVRDDVYAYDENYKQLHLWKILVGTRHETRITDGPFSVTAYGLSNDGKRLVYHRAPSPLLGDGFLGEVWTANADGLEALQITRNGVPETGAALSRDNSRVIFISGSNEQFETYYNSRLFLASVSGGQPRAIVGEKEPLDVTFATWSRDGNSMYFVANLGVHAELFTIAADGGTPRQLTNGKHNIAALSVSGSRLVFTISDSSGTDIYTMTAADSTPRRITHVSAYFAREFKLGRQEAITWKGADGATVEGILTYPADYAQGQRYPLVVITHGGPQAADKYSVGTANAPAQVLAGKGYAVLQPNYRGSTGYGDTFLRDMIGHYFHNSHLDVMTGVDDVIRRGVADPARLVKMGWSAGGHMTNKIITFTNRFKAASSGAGTAQWVSMYAQSDLRFQRTPWFGGTPWQKNAPIDVYWNNSPLKDVANVTTPTLFFAGERDPRVPMAQSIEMYRALKSNGVPTHLYIGPREPHGWTELRHQLFKVNSEIDWFEKYANARPYTWEGAPRGQTQAVGPRTD
jgi:dipeptidyl aminopeptidase/acylaminoacyl peptidase